MCLAWSWDRLNATVILILCSNKPNDEPSIDVIGHVNEAEITRVCCEVPYVCRVWWNCFIEKYADSSEHNPLPSCPFEFPPGHGVRIYNFVRELKKPRENLNPLSSCVAKKMLNPRKHSTPYTGWKLVW